MGCNLCDDCSECTVGDAIDCGGWDEVEHRRRNHDYYDDYDSYLEYDSGYECDDDEQSSEEEGDMNANSELYCVCCGTKVRENWRYCLRCGTSIPEKHCVRCGRAVDNDWEYCPKCGSSIPNAVDEAPSAAPPVQTIMSPSSVFDEEIPF